MTTSAMLRRSKMEPSLELGSHILNESVCGAWNILCLRSLENVNNWQFQFHPIMSDLRSQFLLKTLWHWLHS